MGLMQCRWLQGEGLQTGGLGPGSRFRIAAGSAQRGLSFPICKVQSSTTLTSNVLPKLEMWLCSQSPASHSEFGTPLERIPGGLSELLCDFTACPPLPSQSPRKGRALRPWWFIDASTAQVGVPPAQGRHGARGGQRATPSAEGKGPGAHVLSSMHLPRPPALIQAKAQMTTPFPVATEEATSCPIRPLTEIWPCWPAAPFCLSSQKSAVTVGAALLHLTSFSTPQTAGCVS